MQPGSARAETTYQRTPATTLAGLCYLAVIAGGLFAEGMVRRTLILPGDPAGTTRAILENDFLWRLGLAVHLLYLVPALVMKVLVSDLFRATEPSLARLALVFGVAAVTIEAVSLVQLYVPIALLEDGMRGSTAGEVPILIYLATQLFTAGFAFSLLLFAGFCLGIGALILRSNRMPRAIGVMMVIAGVSYLINTLAMIVSPDLFAAINPGILLPIFLAELSLALWLLAKGVAREATS